MSAIGYTFIKPISEYVALKAEIAYWKQQFFDLHSKTEANSTSSPSSLYIKDNGITRQVLLTQIIMLEADSNYTRIVLVSGENILTCKTLKYWIGKIGINEDFMRPHRSFLINKKYIVSYQANPRCIIISGNITIPMSRNFDIKDHVHK